jgi:hypothetical protein
MDGKKFVTAINCMDGRTQIPIIKWMKHEYKADYVDMITEPGPIKLLSEKQNCIDSKSIKKRVEISINVHGSKNVAIIGHYDCAGNPVDKETQIKQIKEAADVIKSWDFNVNVVGLWIDNHWIVHKIV